MSNRQTLLVVEDNIVNRKILYKMLSTDYDILEAGNGKEAIEILTEKPNGISAMLLDLIMPVMNGYQVLEYLREEGIVHIPVVVMTGESDDQSEEKALDLGAWDFVMKPYKPKILETRLKNAIARSRMSYLDQITHIAEHDQLTGFYNRRHFFEATDKLLKEHQGEAIAFVRADINQFRLVNSFLGEMGGDTLLKFFAEMIKQHVESYPWCSYGRIESDIFGFFIPFEKEQFERVLEDLIQRVQNFNADFVIEPSFGIYEVKDQTLTAESMFLRASMAAKACKNKYLVYYNYYDDRLDELQKQEQEIMHAMQHALDNEEFLVYYQPKYNTVTKTPYGAEALIRWKSPEKGMISPGQFIPVFERNGLIGKLDYYVWSRVCGQIKSWLDDGIKLAPISVNMSRAELSNPKLVDMLTGLVSEYGIETKYLNLELTESAYMDNPEAMNSVIDRLHKAGFTILMDDFGSGYSSLNTLKDINVDILKIDMKFLSLDDTNTKSKKILASVIGMAQWIGLPIITEGVETQEQFDFLQSIGCEYIQGYYFARPMPTEEYDALVRSTEAVEAKYSSRIDEEYMIPSLLKEKIYRDELTGAYNRRYMNEWLFLDIDDFNKKSPSFGLIMLDLKSFKQTNDAAGHLAGDEILKKVSAVLLASTRKKDAVIRYGGDEFIIILTGCPESIVVQKVEEMQSALNQMSEENGLFKGADFGYSYMESFVKDKKVLLSMIKEADENMYFHKKNNR